MSQNKPKSDNDMKKLVFILISLMCVSPAFARKNKNAEADVKTKENKVSVTYLEQGGIKFHLENKEKPTTPLKQITGRECWEKILYDAGVAAQDNNIKTFSETSDNLVCFNRNACFEGFLTAFDKHYSLVLSPDMIWLLISQGIATHINENAESLRDRLVDFEGQRTLSITTERDLLENEQDWNWIIPAFCDSIDCNMKGQFSDLMVCNFSTTGLVERISSQITMMESVKKFFKYEVMRIGCGIPDITLLGTPDDWKEIRSRLSRLDDLDLSWWRRELEPVLDEFVNASQGKVNRKFWLDMVKQYSPERRQQAFCGSSGIVPAEYNGWFTVFFPFVEKENVNPRISRTPKTVTHNTKVCSEIKKTDVLYRIIWDDHEEIHNLELWAGFIGMEMDWENRTLKPSISWMMREKSSTDKTLANLNPDDLKLLKQMGEWGMLTSYDKQRVSGFYSTYKNEYSLVACRFPLIPMFRNYEREDEHCHRFTVISLEEITVPSDLGEWCRKNHIEKLTVKAPMTDEQKADILSQFPDAEVVQL